MSFAAILFLAVPAFADLTGNCAIAGVSPDGSAYDATIYDATIVVAKVGDTVTCTFATEPS